MYFLTKNQNSQVMIKFRLKMSPLISMATENWFGWIYNTAKFVYPSFRKSLYESDRSKKLLLQFTTARLKWWGCEKTYMKAPILSLSLITCLLNLFALNKGTANHVDRFLEIPMQRSHVCTTFILMRLTKSSWNTYTLKYTYTHNLEWPILPVCL